MIKLLTLSILLLTGCATFTAPQKKPVLSEEFELNGGSNDLKLVMSHTTANRRVIFSDLYTGSICVEPPPGSANSISDSLATILDTDVKDKVKLAAEISNSTSQRINQLYRRTQTVQLYRDAVFSLCQEKVNSYMLGSNLNEEDRKEWNKAVNIKYQAKFDELLKKSYTLLEYEIPKFYNTEKLRFITEIIKPIVVCESEVEKRPIKENKKVESKDANKNDSEESEIEGDKELDNKKESITILKSGCKAVLPNGAVDLIKAYSQTLKN